MNPNESNPMPGFDELLLVSTLVGIEQDASPSQIETVLRSVAGATAALVLAMGCQTSVGVYRFNNSRE
jgi:hypothetical protein